jgi:hypothetical protein
LLFTKYFEQFEHRSTQAKLWHSAGSIRHISLDGRVALRPGEAKPKTQHFACREQKIE